MKMQLSVDYHDGGTDQFTISPLAMIGWEKWSGRKMSDLASTGSGLGMGDMVWMAWEQARLSGKTTDDYEAWAATLADIDAVDTESPTSGSEEA